ncbi:MAG TPA: dicarboxylate/amino acid:cation symporter [Polyangiaceae bacterium]|nr:dicarboxylate/amino acid:cation symporter [Polyangiaceae bacterium]
MNQPAVISSRRPCPLYLRVLLGSLLGIALGAWLGPGASLLGFGVSSLSDAGMAVVRILKLLGTPLLFFCVLDAILGSEIPRKKTLGLLLLSAANAAVAILIALGCAHWLRTGAGQFPALRAIATSTLPSTSALNGAGSAGWLPENLVDPFRQNSVIVVVLLGVAFGLGLRAVRKHGTPDEIACVTVVSSLTRAGLQTCLVVLSWVLRLVPFAVAGVLAGAVAKTGLGALRSLGPFVATVLLGLLLHVCVYYGFLISALARRSPLAFFRGIADALLTALSSGSSIATLPVTLSCLERLGISKSSARLAACVGTNLNHDGIILYEAAATLFVVQALGLQLSIGAQLGVAAAAATAGVGIAGVPEAGLITLPLVLGAAGVPSHVAAAVLPLILPVDWILGRFRAATNVASDATVAAILERLAPGALEDAQEVSTADGVAAPVRAVVRLQQDQVG